MIQKPDITTPATAAISIKMAQNGFSILHDGRPVLTPGGNPLVLPYEALAFKIAEEWRLSPRATGAAVRTVRPLTVLANTAIDRIIAQGWDVRGQILAYAGSDLLCYRALSPQELAVRQRKLWQPPLDWVARRFGVRFTVVAGIVHQPQPPDVLAAIDRHLASMDGFRLAAVYSLSALTSSAVLALAVEDQAVTPDCAWRAAELDGDWQAAHWGEDAEAAKGRTSRARDFRNAVDFLAQCR